MRRLRIIGAVVATALATVTPALSMARPAGAATTTVVSLTFDDGLANQSVVPAMLQAHGMRGTFYVNTNLIDAGGLTWAQLQAYQAAGHEIGGHTLDHADLPSVPLEQAGTQICQDRANLMSHGINATDFAYPYGNGYDVPAIVNIVKGCGYNSARRANGLYSHDRRVRHHRLRLPVRRGEPAHRPVRHPDR